MRWKRVAWAGCLAPVLGGCCGPLCGHGKLPDALTAHSEKAVEHEIRKDAKTAWHEVRCQFPRRDFTHEFREGFLDGYTDYLDRGGAGQPPAVPPARFTREKRYYSPDGHARIRDYYLGFKYGQDVAVATGNRQFYTVPVLIPDKDQAPPVAVAAVPPGVGVPTAPVDPAQPLPAPTPLPKTGLGAATPPNADVPAAEGNPKANPEAVKPTPLPLPRVMPEKPDKPKAPWVNPPTPGGTSAETPEPGTRLPAPSPPLPTIPSLPTGPVPPTAPVKPGNIGVKLPEPPAEVPNLPDHVPTPSVADELPVIPPNHTAPMPLPPNHPPAEKKE